MGPALALITPNSEHHLGHAPRVLPWAAAAGAAAMSVCVAAGSVSWSATVAAGGLGALAATDGLEHRLPRSLVRAAAVAVCAAAVASGFVSSDWSPATRGLLALTAVAVSLGTLWMALPGAVAFGDVKVTTVASAAAATASWRAVLVMLLIAPVAGGAWALVQRRRHHPRSAVPFIPGLALGFLVGVLIP